MSGAFYYFENLHDFIKIRNTKTGTNSFVSKSNIVIQQDNEHSFFVKNDSYIKYFKTSEIVSPTGTLEEILTELLSMISTGWMTDLLNDLEKSDAVFELSMASDENNKYIDSRCVKDGVEQPVDSNWINYIEKENVVEMKIPIAPGTYTFVRQSREHTTISTGKTNITIICGKLISSPDSPPGETACKTRIGLFDDENEPEVSANQYGTGMFFEYDSSTFDDGEKCAIVLKYYDSVGTITEKRIVQNQWNKDKMDGNGSGYVFDPTNMNTFVFKYTNIPNSTIQFGVITNGVVVTVHEEDESNGIMSNFNLNAKLPIRWEMEATVVDGATDVRHMLQGNAVVYSNEKHFSKLYMQSFCPDSVKHFNSSSRENLLFSMKLDDRYIKNKIKISNINLYNSSQNNSIVKWKLIRNGNMQQIDTYDTSTGTYTPNVTSATGTYTSYSKVAIQHYIDSSFTIDGVVITYTNYFRIEPNSGETVASGYITNDQVTTINTKSLEYITSNITGVSDVYSLMLYYVNSDAEVQFSLDWEEYE
jgi:hypothetical protein